METKQKYGGKIKSLDESGRGSVVFSTTGVVDKDNDVTLSGAFGSQFCAMVPAHQWTEAPIGKGKIYEDGNEAIFDFQMNLETTSGRDWHASLKWDYEHPPALQQYSYGFNVKEYSFGEFEGQRVRFLKKLEVFEVSPVLVGAGVNTRTLDLKRGRSQQSEWRSAEKTLAKVRGFFLHEQFQAMQKKLVKQRANLLAAEFNALTKSRYVETHHGGDFFDQCFSIASTISKALGVKTPRLRFFRDARRDERGDFTYDIPVLGRADPETKTVWVKDGQHGAELVDTVAHEISHCYGANEDQAAAFGRKIAREWNL